jgi:hypothetical protein
MAKEEMVSVVIVEPNKPAKVKVIKNTLEAKQIIVGGQIECLGYDGYDILFNENGKFEDLEPNFGIFNGKDYIAGTAIFIGMDYDSGEFISLSPEQRAGIVSQFNRRES